MNRYKLHESNWVLLILTLISGIILCVTQNIALPWSYYTLSASIGIVLTLMVLTSKETRWHIYISIVAVALLLINMNNLATDFSVLPFYDSYYEYFFSRSIAVTKNFDLNMLWGYSQNVYREIFDPASYPLYSILTVIVSSITNLDLYFVCLVIPQIIGLLAMVFIGSFVKVLTKKINLIEDKIVPLAMLIVSLSPDFIYNGMHYYHRHYSLTICFMVLYLFMKYLVSADMSTISVFIFALLSLPLTYGYYPTVYIIFIFWVTLFIFIAKTFIRKNEGFPFNISFRVPSAPFLLIASSGFLWYLNVTYPNTIVKGVVNYLSTMLNPRLMITELDRMGKRILPEILTLYPFDTFLQIRFVLLIIPVLIGFILVVYSFLKKRDGLWWNRLLLYCTLGFGPLVFSDVIVGYWLSLEVRYYAMPLTIVYVSLLFATLLKKKIVGKSITLVLISLLIFLAFLAPFSHQFFARYIYDPAIEPRDVGVPSSDYVNIRSFFEEGYIGKGVYMSDHPLLLSSILSAKDYDLMRNINVDYGVEDSYVFEFIDFNPTLTSHSQKHVDIMRQIKHRVPLDYDLVLDNANYKIYYR